MQKYIKSTLTLVFLKVIKLKKRMSVFSFKLKNIDFKKIRFFQHISKKIHYVCDNGIDFTDIR